MPTQHSPKSSPANNVSNTRESPTSQSTQGNFPIFSLNQKKRKMTDGNSHPMDDSVMESSSECSMAEMFKAMKFINDNINDNINQLREQQNSSFNDLRHDVNGKFEAMDIKVNSIDAKANQASSDIVMLKAKLNEIEQEKLASRMEIMGIDKAEIEAHKLDPASLALKVMNRFNIQLNRNVIQNSYFREWKQRNVSILVVNFVSVEVKAEVMKKKRAATVNNNIFFDHVMTPATRKLFVEAKKKAKGINARFAFISQGKVFISMDTNKKVKIDTIEDLDSIVAPVANNSSSISSSGTSSKSGQ